MVLEDPEDLNEASNFLIKHEKHFGNADGWVFVSHRGVNRGMDINGIEAATMVINYKYASGFELQQTLGRGNRCI